MVGNVPLDRGPVAAGADGGEIETIGPELPSPEFFLEIRKPFEEFLGLDALEQSHDGRPGVLGVESAKNVDVVPVGTDLIEDNVVANFNLSGDFDHGRSDSRGEEGFTVFDGKDDVLVSIIDTVVTSGEAHASILALETEGFQTFLQGTPPQRGGERTYIIHIWFTDK